MANDRDSISGGQLVATLLVIGAVAFLGYRYGPGLYQRLKGDERASPSAEWGRYAHQHVTSRFGLKIEDGGGITLEGWVKNSGDRPIYGIRVRLSSSAFDARVIDLGDLPAGQKRTYSRYLGQAPAQGKGAAQVYSVTAFQYGKVDFSFSPRAAGSDSPD